MTRDEYLAQLRALLTGRMPPDELDRILTYYAEYFAEAGPAGEARVAQELGTPAELVSRILGAKRVRETPAERTPPPRGSGNSSLWKALLAICAAPIAGPLILAAAAVVVVLVLAVVCVVAGIAIGGVVAIGVGIVTAWSGFSVLFSAGMATMMFFCGMGMLSSGVGLLMIAGSFALCGLCFRAMAGAVNRWLLRREARV